MPLYDYKCPDGHRFAVFTKIGDYKKERPCEDCGKTSIRFITGAPMVRGDLPGYNCPITNKWVEGRRQHEENLKKHGCRILEPGESQQAVAFRKQVDEQLEKSIEATAEEFVVSLDATKREQLAAELDNGADVTVGRQ